MPSLPDPSTPRKDLPPPDQGGEAMSVREDKGPGLAPSTSDASLRIPTAEDFARFAAGPLSKHHWLMKKLAE